MYSRYLVLASGCQDFLGRSWEGMVLSRGRMAVRLGQMDLRESYYERGDESPEVKGEEFGPQWLMDIE